MTRKRPLDRLLIAFVKTRLGRYLFTGPFSALDKRLMPLIGGRSLAVGHPVCLLHTVGAKTGKPRRTALLFTPSGDDIVVAASRGGAPTAPAWYFNVRANPRVDVDIRGKRHAMVAREAEGREREQLWALLNDHFDGYEQYQERIDRRIPVIVLSPVG